VRSSRLCRLSASDRSAVRRRFRHTVIKPPVPERFCGRRFGRDLALAYLSGAVDPLLVETHDRLPGALLEIIVKFEGKRRGAPIVKKPFYRAAAERFFQKQHE